jgi:hypothetical protein
MTCPNCGSDRTRRGGMVLWTIYLVLIALAVPAVVVFHLHGGIVGGIVIAVIVIANLVLDQRVCLDCGNQWRRRDDKPS